MRLNAMYSVLAKFSQRFLLRRNIAYIQGQEPEPKIREYFYFIDHQGMVRD